MELAIWICKFDGKAYLKLSGEILSYIRLSECFFQAGQRAQLQVDKLTGEFQAVIKCPGRVFSKTKDIRRFTVEDSADVVLVADVD